MSETQVTGEPAEDTADAGHDEIVIENAAEDQDGDDADADAADADADGEDAAEDGGEDADDAEVAEES